MWTALSWGVTGGVFVNDTAVGIHKSANVMTIKGTIYGKYNYE